MTSRGSWFLFLIMLQSLLGILLSEQIGPILAVVGFGLLTWFTYEWVMFRLRVQFALPRLAIRRIIRAERREVPIVWAQQEFDVIVEFMLHSRLTLPYVTFQDRPPSGCERLAGRDDRVGSLSEGDRLFIEYSLRCEVPGELRFEGVRVQLADPHGFFYHRTFCRQPEAYLVLPPLSDAGGHRRTYKSHNVLPPPGVHRLRQSGSGSELHDLRDYRPGDPPKTIAWKTSARRDRLIIKEFESDVPIRCTLFVDVSPSVRIGTVRETMLNQVTTIASGVAQAALADRDHVGLVLFDEANTEVLRPARTSRHLIELLHRLARANSAAPVSPAGDIDSLVALANPLAHEIYPDLMNRSVNQLPLRMFWEPLLDSTRAWIALALMLPLLSLLGWLVGAALCLAFDFPEMLKGLLWAKSALHELFDSLLWPLIITLALALFAMLFWLAYGLSGHFPPWHTNRMRRKRLAAVIAVLENAPPGTESRYLDDDSAFAESIQRFLATHHRRFPVNLFDDQGRYLFRSEGKIDILAKVLLHAVAHGRDNELFVILADLFELQDRLDPLIRAVKVASARHHQVLVICPWLSGIPIVDENLSEAERAKEFRRLALQAGFRGVETQLFRQTAEQYHKAFHSLRHEFGRCGVLLARAQQHESIRLILNRMDRLRGVRSRR